MQEDVYQGDGLNLYAYCGNNPVMYYDPSGYDGYYFRGTTIGYGGHANKDYSNVSTDPAVATAYAVKGQTIYGEKGIVYIATDSDLAGIDIDSYELSIPKDKELFVSLSPEEFANAASISLDVSEARTILENVSDVDVPLHIYSENDLDWVLENNYDRVDDEQIKKFVEEASALNNEASKEESLKDSSC